MQKCKISEIKELYQNIDQFKNNAPKKKNPNKMTNQFNGQEHDL